MKKIYILSLSLFGLFAANRAAAQNVTLISEDFETASNPANTSGSSGSWTQDYLGTLAAYPYNIFAIQSGCTGLAITGTQSMQVTGITSSTATCAYQNISATNAGYAALIYKQVDATNVTSLLLSYKWKCGGVANQDYGNLVYTTDLTGAAGWTTIGANLNGSATTPTTVTALALPAALNNTKFLLGWKFTANNTGVTAPGLIVDDVSLVGTTPTAPLAVGTIVADQGTGPVSLGSTQNALLRIAIPVTGTTGTLTLSNFVLTSGNTNNADVTGVQLWLGDIYNPITQLGTSQTFSGSTATFSGLTGNLTFGTNYLWVLYDVSTTATIGNILDGSVAVGGITITAAGGATAPGTLPTAALNPADNLYVDYCAVDFPSDVEPITSVVFADITNTSSGTLSTTPAYENYTSIVGNVVVGQSYTMSVKGNTGGNYTDSVKAFIDWNRDGIFDEATEAYKVGVLTNTTGADATAASVSITVPATAQNGTTRMRIVKRFVNGYTSPCATSGYGQAEDYTLSVTGAVPVGILSFTGERKGSVNELKFTTATELNNKGFEILRSADGIAYSSIAFVKSLADNGNSNGLLQYSFADEKAFTGNNYYRLKQIDKDGKSTLSQVVFIKGGKVGKLELSNAYPNPAISILNVVVASPKADKITLIVTDVAGKLVMQQQLPVNSGDNILKLDVNTLKSGSYLIKAICEDGCETAVKKFVKQ